MHVYVVTEAHFRLNVDGVVCSDLGGRGYSFWQRYLAIFDSVTVIGRLFLDKGSAVAPVEGDRVDFLPLPGYIGFRGFVKNYRKIRKSFDHVFRKPSAFIFRVPSVLVGMIIDELRSRNLPYAVEVVGDPYDSFAPGAINHPLRPLFRWWLFHQMRKQCENARVAAYVTTEALQRRYPCSGYSIGVSDVDLPSLAFAQDSRLEFEKSVYHLITVGGLGHLYKAQDVLIEAINVCVKNGLNVRLSIVGDGKYRTKLESQVDDLSMNGFVKFVGLLPSGEAVRNELDKADLFILPSRQEGLPRALVEAMARGLPCIGSTVGGIPELLPPEDMTLPNDVNGLADKIHEVISDPNRMLQMSVRNLKKSKEFCEVVLREKRNLFYQYVKTETQKSL